MDFTKTSDEIRKHHYTKLDPLGIRPLNSYSFHLIGGRLNLQIEA